MAQADTRRFSLTARDIPADEVHDEVEKVQLYLARYGYLTGPYEPKRLDTPTQQALQEFQGYMNIPQTSVVDPDTAAALEEPRCGNPDVPPKHYGFEDVEFCFRAWRLGAVLLAVPTARIEHLFRGGQPFEVPQGSLIYNATRTAVLHLTGERLKATLEALSTHPDFAKQIIELFAGDVFARRSFIDARACKDMEEYFEAFPIQ